MAMKTMGKRKPKKRVEKLRICPSSDALVSAQNARSWLVGRPPGAGGASGVLISSVVVLTEFPAISDAHSCIHGRVGCVSRRGAACQLYRERHLPARRA